jgi:hypothetical protein
MVNLGLNINYKNPVNWFCIGWCLILLVPILPLMPNVQTFIHPWRPEFAASLLFFATSAYLLY